VSDDGPHQEKQISGVEAKGSDQRAMIKKFRNIQKIGRKLLETEIFTFFL